MKRVLSLVGLVCGLLLVGCGEGGRPESLPGDDQAGLVALSFLNALEAGDFEKAQSFLAADPDRTLENLEVAYQTFFTERSTGLKIRSTGKLVMESGYIKHGLAWHHFVDVKIRYGTVMKPLRFFLTPSASPKVKGVEPLKLEGQEEA